MTGGLPGVLAAFSAPESSAGRPSADPHITRILAGAPGNSSAKKSFESSSGLMRSQSDRLVGELVQDMAT